MDPTAGRRMRRLSMEEPPTMTEMTRSVLAERDSREQRMKEIVTELKEMAEYIRKKQERADKARTLGAYIGRLGFVLFILAVLFPGWSSVVTAAVAVIVAGSGAAAVFVSNVTKTLKENGSVQRAEELGTELMMIAESPELDLESVRKRTGEESSGAEAENLPEEVQEFQRTLRRVSAQRKKGAESLFGQITLDQVMNTLTTLTLGILSTTATPEEDKRLTSSIRQLADQGHRVIHGFHEMSQKLRDCQQPEAEDQFK
ncbi:uncharacterized protein LOC141805607 [Halichoeres trimaculatus]|uniref:uncharacterized protein LOC141805607 n=1 Tax=Halichoeres trimaculatus TaxID=147232 RepID=UPI003D9EEC54